MTLVERTSRWYRGRSSAAVISRNLAPIVRPRPGWLSTAAGVVATVTAWSVHPVAAGVVATVSLLIAEARAAQWGSRVADWRERRSGL